MDCTEQTAAIKPANSGLSRMTNRESNDRRSLKIRYYIPNMMNSFFDAGRCTRTFEVNLM